MTNKCESCFKCEWCMLTEQMKLNCMGPFASLTAQLEAVKRLESKDKKKKKRIRELEELEILVIEEDID